MIAALTVKLMLKSKKKRLHWEPKHRFCSDGINTIFLLFHINFPVSAAIIFSLYLKAGLSAVALRICLHPATLTLFWCATDR